MELGKAVAACFGAILSIGSAAAQADRLDLAFGVYSFKKPTEVYKEFAPTIERMQRDLGQVLGLDVAISIKLYKTYEECLDRFVAGEIDFVRFGPASYVLARQRRPGVQILAIEQEAGAKLCKGVIVVRSDSDIAKIEDLRGRRFAFGDSNSTIGRYLSQAELVKHGIRSKDLIGFRYLERHDKVFKAVEIGDFDAGALHIGTYQDLNKERQLRVLATFDNCGKPWLGRADLDAKVVAGLRKVLLALDDPAVLKALKVDGFLPGTDSDFDPVRAGMKVAEQFEADVRPAAPVPPAPAPVRRG